MPISAAALVGLLIGLGHFLLSRPGERPGLDFVLLSAIAEFWLATILAGGLLLNAHMASQPLASALGTALILWIGFVAPVLLVTLRFRGKPGHMAAADSLHWLAVMLAQTLVMYAIGLVAPPM